MEFVTEIGLRLSGEVTPTAILITNGVGKGDLGMVTSFCSHNQIKMEASEALPLFASMTYPCLEYSW